MTNLISIKKIKKFVCKYLPTIHLVVYGVLMLLGWFMLVISLGDFLGKHAYLSFLIGVVGVVVFVIALLAFVMQYNEVNDKNTYN